MNEPHHACAADQGIYDLLAPAALGRYRLRNRIVMAPMTRNRAGPGNAATAGTALYYAQRASAGFIVTEGTQVSPRGLGYPNTPGIHSQTQVNAWRRTVDAVHALGGRIFLQLWHVGRISHPALQPGGELPVAPSALPAHGKICTGRELQPMLTPRALGSDEIADVVAEFRAGANNALAAGFDGVEIHAANGYLIDQFLRDGSNRRTDAYGGTVENRARLLLEVTESVIQIYGADRVGVRLSPLSAYNSMADSAPQATFGHAVEALNRYRLAYLHVVEVTEPQAGPAFDLAILRQRFRGSYIANGGYDYARAQSAIVSGTADFVAFGRYYIANPDLAERFAAGAALNTAAPSRFHGGDACGYTDYPFLDPRQGEQAARLAVAD